MTSSSQASSLSLRVFNQSKVKLYLRCRQAYFYRYEYPALVMGKPGQELVPKYPSLPLKRGSWMHALQQAYWLELCGLPVKRTIKRGKRTTEMVFDGWEELHEQLSVEFERLFDEEREQYGDLPNECRRMFRGYLRRWRDDNEKYKVAVLPKRKPAVEFIIEYPLDKWGLSQKFKGQIDLLVEDLEYGGLWIRDAKWVKTIPGPDERMMSPQNIMYVSIFRRMGYDVRGFIYDYGRTKVPTVPRTLQRSTRYGPAGSVSLAKCDTDYTTYVRAIKKAHGKQAKALMKTYYRDKLEQVKAADSLWFTRERIPVEGPRVAQGFREFIQTAREMANRKAGPSPRTYIYSCKWNCDYHEPCVAQFQGMDVERLMKTRYELTEERYTMEDID